MTREDILNGLAGPRAQANEMLAIVNEAMWQAIQEIALVAGSKAEDVQGSYPYIHLNRREGDAP